MTNEDTQRLLRLTRRKIRRSPLTREEQEEHTRLKAELCRLTEEAVDPAVATVLKMRYLKGMQWNTLAQALGIVTAESARKSAKRYLARQELSPIESCAV